MGEYVAIEVCGKDRAEVSLTEPCCKAVLSLLRILPIAQALGQLDIIFYSKGGKSIDAARNKAGEIKVELDSDETNLLAASRL